MKVKPHKFKGVFTVDNKLATVNLIPGFKSSNENLVKEKNTEYRIWDPFTSKPSAAIIKGIKIFPIAKGMKILYLGMAEGKTASFFSDIVDKEGNVFGVEISERSLRDSIFMCEKRGNIIPILGDARKPEMYENIVLEKVDLVYEDVASPDQVQILIRNSERFLNSNGFSIITIKSQSIDSVKSPAEVYKNCLNEFKKHFKIIDKVELDPYQKNHLFVVMKLK
jgi:fibrillarin-like pre-rRNA processing protein